jgi:DNA-binding response OmpR family regulator
LTGFKFVELAAEASASIGRYIQQLARAREIAAASGRPILVAEDDTSVLGFLVRVLTGEGYQVQTATRGDDAIVMIRKHHPALVLLDVLMPGADGREICRRVRGDAEIAHIPVILMSALEGESLHALALETGASDYIAKPVAIADLLATVAKYVKR